ncbi:MAG: lytic transglycosylase domain-containing protein [Thiobacillaceae bacterium]
MPLREYALALLLIGSGLCQCGWADIYIYTADDGAVSLSNVPADNRYTVLISAPQVPAPHVPVSAQPDLARSVGRESRYERLVDKVSTVYGVDSALIHAVISVESGYDPKARSRKGAAGLMQLMPKTAKRYGVVNAFDPAQNLDGGARYLRDLLGIFDHNVDLALAAYNAGETAVVRHHNQIPPFRETLHYVPRVLDLYRRYQASM